MLVAGLPEVLRSADARIVARGVEWREVRTWLRRRHDHGRSPYDIAFGHALQAVGRVAGERGIAIVHDETPRWKHLCSTAERARTRGVYSHCREPVAGLSSIAFDDSFASRLIQIADVYAWAFQRVWARTTGRRRGAQSAPHADPATEAARRFLLGAKDLVAERYVWRPRARRG